MDLGTLAFLGQRQDKVGVLFGGCFDRAVGGEWDCCAKRLGGGGVAEPPDGFDFGRGEGQCFGDVEVGGEGFEAGGGFWKLGAGRLRDWRWGCD